MHILYSIEHEKICLIYNTNVLIRESPKYVRDNKLIFSYLRTNN